MGEKEDKAEAEKKAAEEKAAAEKRAEEEAKKKAEESAKSNSIIDEHKAEREKMDKTLEAIKKENDRTEKLQGEAILAGKGEIQKEQSEDDKWAADAKERYKGTGMDPTPDDTETKYS